MGQLAEGQSVTIGASPPCDIIVSEASVSGSHIRVTRQGDQYLLEDLGSTNGTFVDDYRIEPHCMAHLQSTVSLGSYQTTLGQLLAMQGAPAAVAPVPQRSHPRSPDSRHHTDANISKQEVLRPVRVVEVSDKMLIIGRLHDCDETIPEPTVSGRHARVFTNCGRMILEDMGSVAGVQIRTKKKPEWTSYRTWILQEDDEVKIGPQLLQFKRKKGAGLSTQGARIDVRDLVYEVDHNAETGRRIKLLNSVSFTAQPGEVIGILGPSGSGKTTLLDILAGYKKPQSGQVLLNGNSIFDANGAFGEGMGMLTGHAPQYDEVHAKLTVEEAVRYSAELRSPADWTPSRINELVDRSINDVAMEAETNKLVGSSDQKTISGGQRKRVNIAMELVNEPKVLLMDEPSSGLSSHDTADLMQLVRRLADKGNTVILTIHQPSYSAFVLMDKILILEAGGFTAYYGPAAKDSFEYFGVTDREPEALLEQMERKPNTEVPGDWAKKFSGSETKKRFVDNPRASLDKNPMSPVAIPASRGGLEILSTLVRRNLGLKMRDPFFKVLCGVVPIVVSLLFAFVMNAGVPDKQEWSQASAGTEHSYLLVLTIMTCFFGALSSALEIISENPILKRERRGGVGLLPYIVSKAVTYAVPSVIFPALAIGVLWGMTGKILQADPLEYWLILAPTFFAAACAGLLISSLLKSQEVVIVVAVFFAIVQVVFSVFVPLNVTYDQPDEMDHMAIQAMAYPITASWALRGLVTQSDLCLESDDDTTANITDRIPRPFMERCKKTFYRDHAVKDVDDSGQRTNDKHGHNSILVNLLLGVLALMGAGVVLSKRTD